MNCYEYKIIKGTFHKYVNPGLEIDIEKNLNELGKEGWEAYAVSSGNGYSTEIYLKRELL